MASKVLGLASGVGAVVGVALVFLAPPPKPPVDAAAFSGELDGRLRESAAGAHARADTLANLPSLKSSVSTDAKTVRDQTQTELAFRPNPGETITIAQVPKDGAPVVLITLPDGAAPAQGLDHDGPRVEVIGGKLFMIDVLSVVPSYRAEELRGALAISWPLDLGALAQRSDAANVVVRLEVGNQTLNLGSHELAADAQPQTLSLTTPAAGKLRAQVLASPVKNVPLRPIGAGVFALSVLAGALQLRRGSSREADPSVARTHPVEKRTSSNNAGATAIGVGSVIQDTYEVTRLLGQGGMGTVWQAQHLRLPDKRVAIKLLVGEEVHEELFARFQREAEVTSKLGHPNIVGVLDFNTLPTGAPYIVLELLEGESLSTRLLRGPITLAPALEITRQIGSALYAAHRAEIIHRDLKPDNVFLVPVESDGVSSELVKVLDFGISKMRGGVSVNTQDATMLGTPQYMSPEQANGKNSEVDARSDVWALGAIVYEMLTGQCAFAGESLATVVVKIVVQPSPSLRGMPGIPDHVAAAVDKALAKEPADRFPDIKSFIAALTGAPLTQTRNVEPIG